jgi:hypothetical protein
MLVVLSRFVMLGRLKIGLNHCNYRRKSRIRCDAQEHHNESAQPQHHEHHKHHKPQEHHKHHNFFFSLCVCVLVWPATEG